MSVSRFFIERPIFAWVVGIIIMLFGTVSLSRLPVSQYPGIAPPQIAITVAYPGASAQTINDTVVLPILQQMHGLDHLEYVSAQSNASGQMEIDLTFEQAANPDTAQVQVQNRLQLAQPLLPPEVAAQGLSVAKESRNFMLVLGFISTSNTMTAADISDYVASHIADPLSRISGVGDHILFGSEYAMRIWLDPARLYQYDMTVADVQRAITAQNVQVAAGELGGLPATKDVVLDAIVIGPHRLKNADEFRRIILRVREDGSRIRLSDVAKVELGPQTSAIASTYNNLPASGLALKLAPGANQLQTEAEIRACMSRLEHYYPPGLKTVYPLDTAPFITLSIHELIETLLEAIVLVFLVMLVFLQNVRATVIPTIAIPVVILGTFGGLGILGYSLNTLTMLAMVLAVGLLVDDAIVVVENVERVMTARGLPPQEAALQSMGEISRALFGIVFVLTAVFAPMAMIGGSTGVIYRQFAVTIIMAMWLSVLVAVIMTPSLCATLLRPQNPDKKNRLAEWFDRRFAGLTRFYLRGVACLVRRLGAAMAAFVVLTACVGWLFMKLPDGFIPDEDQGIIFGQVSLPPGATMARTAAVTRRVTDYILKAKADSVESVFVMNGFNFAGQSQSTGAFFVRLKDWKQRRTFEQISAVIGWRIMEHFASDPDAQVFAVDPPAVMELGNATGFDLELVDSGQVGHETLLAARNMVLAAAARDTGLDSVRANGLEDMPQFGLDVDRERAAALGLTMEDVNTTIEGALGSSYVNQFMQAGRVKQVYIQGQSDSRMRPADLDKWYIRNVSGTLVPLSSFTSGHWGTGPQKVENYNGAESYEILGEPAFGHSSGEAMRAISDILRKLPEGISYEWTGLSHEQAASARSTRPLYVLASVAIFLCLAALYESWAIPLSVVMVIPLGVLGAIAATMAHFLANDVYFQVGLLTTVGLSVKNAILIVEFARASFEQGHTLEDAVLKAAGERLRPILMTSIAFVFGVFPLAIASGAGASARVAIGTCVVGGMLSATLLAIYFVPVFFVGVLRVFRVRRNLPPGTDGATVIAHGKEI